jgi:hypothetical protein
MTRAAARSGPAGECSGHPAGTRCSGIAERKWCRLSFANTRPVSVHAGPQASRSAGAAGAFSAPVKTKATKRERTLAVGLVQVAAAVRMGRQVTSSR